MEFPVGPSALRMVTYRAFCFVILLTSSVRSRGVTSRPMTSSALAGSHLLFYLAVEKELVPQTEDLAQRALFLLQTQCHTLNKSTSQCMTEAEQLPAIPALGDFPSQKTLRKEGTKIFTKCLLKEAHANVHKLERLAEEEAGEGPKALTDLITHMAATRRHLKAQIESLYRLRIRERKYAALKTTKYRYLKRPRIKGGNCPAQAQDCATMSDYRLRLLYTLYSRLLRINHVLDYTVQLSWSAVERKSS
ncbi:uncharacterized protein LOC143300162 [Babylonia areolata]|uniref:uncharacterized protein LOC143300162 n=1 Tax=Babylonia areolata TaxID=304850 RepID=UPI003FCF6C52